MKQSILVTGVPGTGKTSISDHLVKMGYRSYDMDRMHGLFVMINKQTGEVVNHVNNADLGEVLETSWICVKEKLNEMITHQTEEVAFYCGMPSNVKELLSLFNKIILLRVDDTTSRHRLTYRTGRNDFGRTAEVQDWILTWKHKWENEMITQGAIVIDAHSDLDNVANEIIKTL